jgi:hypothetical protein
MRFNAMLSATAARPLFCALSAIVFLAGCSADGGGGEGDAPSKDSLFRSGKFDDSLEDRVCRSAGLPEGCDVCEAGAYYGDGECDTFCPSPDSDCEGTCNVDADCPQIYCITTPCPQYVCRESECVFATDCAPMDAAGSGLCELMLGYVWNGVSCLPVSGCSCAGVDCERIFANQGECEDAHLECLSTDPCDAQDASGSGPCEAFFGYHWDGAACAPLSGCSCVGADCGSTYFDLSQCEAEHVQCVANSDDCVVGGCSGQLCYDPDTDSGISTCEWRAQYACYQTAICERQGNNECGWTPTEELAECLAAPDCPLLSPPRDGFCGEGGPEPRGLVDPNGCVVGYECESFTDCRDASSACGGGSECQWCWGSYACVPKGARC